MAQQESLIKLKGKIGDLTFFKTKDGYQARKKGGISAERIANDPAYLRTRENNVEFGLACSSAKKMKDLLRPVVLQVADPKMSTRLSQLFSRIIKADSINLRGQRKVLAENLTLFKNFDLNVNAPIHNTIIVDYQLKINRDTGSINLDLPAFKPEVSIVKPKGATHFRLMAATALLDFEGEGSALTSIESEYLDLQTSTTVQQLVMATVAESPLPIFVLFGISFYQIVNNVHYGLNNGGYNALGIIAVEQP